MKKNDILDTMAFALAEAVDAEIRQAKWEESERIRDLLGMKPYATSVRGEEEYYSNIILWSNVPLITGGEYTLESLLKIRNDGALLFLNHFKPIDGLR